MVRKISSPFFAGKGCVRVPWLLALVLVSVLGIQPASAEPDSVNVNTADAATIAEVLQGVGMSRAEAIVAYRDQHGEFADVYDLANVKGIGDRTVELNEDRIRLTD
jgi:competence protein ComEA